MSDPGSTLALNVVFARAGRAVRLLNINIGDSRTVLFQKEGYFHVPVFAIRDHNAGHERALGVLDRGGVIKRAAVLGKLITVANARQKILAGAPKSFSSHRVSRQSHPEEAAALNLASYTLGMSDAFGDLYLKLAPRLIEGRLDWSRFDLDPSKPYLLVCGTDGLWNTIEGGSGDPRAQAKNLSALIDRKSMKELASYLGDFSNRKVLEASEDDCSFHLLRLN